MIHFNYSTLRRNRSLLFRYLSVLCFSLATLFSNHRALSQVCDKTNCTSSDVRVISAYISGPNNAAIDCGLSAPFVGAELHLIVSSNTQRKGVSLSGALNILDNGNNITGSFPLDHCFSGIQLNNGSNNNLIYLLNSTLGTTACGPKFSLANIFVTWGTGNTNFCTSTAAQCPATPAKCRFTPGETIPVTVKLDVDFSFTPGVCNTHGNSLAVDFTPVITATGLTAPFDYSWDFGDGSPVVSGAVSTLAAITGVSHTYVSAGMYTATLTITDASSTPITKTAVHTFTLTSCCNLVAPNVTAGPFCSGDNKTIGDLPQSDAVGTYHWYNGSDPNNSFELDPTTLLVDGTTYYVSVSSGDCESPRTGVTIVVNQTPGAPTIDVVDNCDGTSTLTVSGLASGATVNWADDATNHDNPRIVSAAGNFIATQTLNSCTSAASDAATAAPKTPPAKPTVSVVDNCDGTSTLTVSGLAAGATVNWTDDAMNHSNPRTVTLAGSYSATQQTVNGCTSDASTAVTAAPKNNPSASITVGSQSCTGGIAQFTLTATTNGSSLLWSKPAGADGSLSSTTTSSTTYTPGVLDKKNGVVITLTTYLNGCSNNATTTLSTAPCGPYFTWTQGFYGNLGGTACTPSGGKVAGGTTGVIATSILNMPNKQLILGAGSKSFTVGVFNVGASATEIANLIKYLPAGKTPAALGGAYNITNALPPLSSNKIANNLLGQAITLKLNVSIPGNALGSFVLQSGYLTTQKRDLSTCPSIKLLSCSKDPSALSSVRIATNATLMNLLAGKTVNDLLAMASAALGGTTVSGVGISDISNAVDVINNAFDGGRFSLGYYATQQSCTTLPLSIPITSVSAIDQNLAVTKLAVAAYPNPYSDAINFRFVSPKSGTAVLEIFDLVGRRLAVPFEGKIGAGITNNVKYVVLQATKMALIYKLTINNESVHGSIMPGDK